VSRRDGPIEIREAYLQEVLKRRASRAQEFPEDSIALGSSGDHAVAKQAHDQTVARKNAAIAKADQERAQFANRAKERQQADEEFVRAYARVARTVMRLGMESQTCVSAARVTCEFFARCGMSVRPVPCKLILKVPAHHFIYVAGGTDPQLRRDASRWFKRTPHAGAWAAHVVAVVQDRWLIDASVDQATSMEHGVVMPGLTLVIDLGPKGDLAIWRGVKTTVRLTDGTLTQIAYSGLHDRTFLGSGAWSDDTTAKKIAMLIEREAARSR
jgi:hypothetical protein